MSEIKLDWAGAQVDGGTLTVEVEGDAPSAWRESFERAVKLLHGGGSDWGEVKLKKKRVNVEGISSGSEEKLHHFLEAVLQQVNADLEQPAEESDEGDERDDDSPDGQMAKRFRAFADEDSEERAEEAS